jgi:tRNA-specific 2-thiouridylase
MSGGVDSSVAAGVLARAGHEVVGATLRLWGGEGDSGCCSVGDVEDARRVAQVLGVDHHVFNYAEEFHEAVVGPYVSSHALGRTPNPCVECNRHIKFSLLAERAWRLGFDALATGHHARVLRRGGQAVLARGVDARKDQSYVLGHLQPEQLERLVLPIGELAKSEVRHLARGLGLRTWDKPDSQDVCFIDSREGRASFLGDRLEMTPAAVIDATSGETVGELPAAELVTLGQRRGVAPGRDGRRRYVTSVDLAARTVTVDVLERTLTSSIELEAGSLGPTARFNGGEAVLAQLSAHGRAVGARLERVGGDRLVLVRPVRPVGAGQSAVLYDPMDPEVVLGAALVGAP